VQLYFELGRGGHKRDYSKKSSRVRLFHPTSLQSCIHQRNAEDANRISSEDERNFKLIAKIAKSPPITLMNMALEDHPSLAYTSSSPNSPLSATNPGTLDNKWNPNYVNRLPDEMLKEVFLYLSHNDLYQCMITCRKWKDVTYGYAVLWRDLELNGNMDQMNAKWKYRYKLAGGGRFESLKINVHERQHKDTLRWEETDICKAFPVNTLKRFYFSNHLEVLFKSDTRLVWASLKGCKRLEVLRWQSKAEARECLLEGTELAKCKLQEFECHFSISRVDKAFVELFTQTRLIHLTSGNTSLDIIYDLLNTAKDTLEDLYLADNGLSADAIRDPPSILPPMEMKRLQSIKSRITNRWDLTAWNFTASKVINFDVAFSSFFSAPIGTAFTAKMLDSCCTNLVHLSYHVGSEEQMEYLIRVLPKLHQCETLCVYTYTTVYEIDFWIYLGLHCLPRLHTLTLEHFRHLTGEEVIEFIQGRRKMDLPSLATLELEDCRKLEDRFAVQLEKLVPVFTIDNRS
jgi:hypothetical protein